MLLDFTNPQGTSFKFPSMYHLTRGSGAQHPGMAPGGLSFDAELCPNDPIGGYFRLAEQIKAQTVGLERDLSNQPELRVPFSREEIFSNQKFPFL
ncbi:MAG: hypothetical protein AB9869_00330 [Verrucomicrobiia bacterium]